MSVVVEQREKAVLDVKGLRRFVNGIDLDGMHTCEQLISWWNFCTQNRRGRRNFGFASQTRSVAMSSHQPLAPELEAKAQELLARLRSRADDELLALARLLVSKEERDIFGDTEFQARDIVHRIGAQAFETHLAQKKTATKAPASSVPTASKAPSSTTTARKKPSA
jgi:hypothetical protein